MAKQSKSSGVAEQSQATQQQQLEAYVFVTMEAAHFRLLLGDLDETKKTMDQCQKILDRFDSVELGVNAAFYRVCGDYHKVSPAWQHDVLDFQGPTGATLTPPSVHMI